MGPVARSCGPQPTSWDATVPAFSEPFLGTYSGATQLLVTGIEPVDDHRFWWRIVPSEWFAELFAQPVAVETQAMGGVRDRVWVVCGEVFLESESSSAVLAGFASCG